MFAEIGTNWLNLGTDALVVQNIGKPGDLIEVVCSVSEPVGEPRSSKLDQIKQIYRISPKSGESIFVRYRRLDGVNDGRVVTLQYELQQGERVQPYAGVPSSVFDGNKAITVQSFSELNSKRGNQFEVAFANPSFPANSSAYYIVQTGSLPVIIKSQIFQFTFGEASTQIFRDPTFTGGNPLPIYNYNDITPAAPEVVFLIGGVVVTNEGVPVSPAVVTYGTAGGGNQRVPSVGASTGSERVLAPNTTYAFKGENLTNQEGKTSGVINFYEGPLSVNNPI